MCPGVVTASDDRIHYFVLLAGSPAAVVQLGDVHSHDWHVYKESTVRKSSTYLQGAVIHVQE